MKIRRFQTNQQLGVAAAEQAARRIRELAGNSALLSVMFATGESQLKTLRALTATADVPWAQVMGFHMDEYLGISPDHPASFRRYMREHLVSRVPMRKFHELNGEAKAPGAVCGAYAELLREHPPQLCLLGIGENGHLAFNDPAEADFEDRAAVKVVSLDRDCRQQQVNEGWFASLAEVPVQAITVTIPVLFQIPELILSVPGKRKSAIVKRTLQDDISPSCPATILRHHPNATVYLDHESAKLL